MNEWMYSPPPRPNGQKETNWPMELNSQTHTVSLWCCQTTWRKKIHLSNLICIHLLWNRIWNSIFDAVRIIIIISSTLIQHPALALSLYIQYRRLYLVCFVYRCVLVDGLSLHKAMKRCSPPATFTSRNSFLSKEGPWCCSNAAEPPYNTWRTRHRKMCFFFFFFSSSFLSNNDTLYHRFFLLAFGRCFHIGATQYTKHFQNVLFPFESQRRRTCFFFIIINEEKRDREGISWLVPPHRTSS